MFVYGWGYLSYKLYIVFYNCNTIFIMISVNILGGLGNQLFQICAMIAYCINTNREFILPYIKLRHADTDRPTYWNSIFDGLEKYTNVNKPEFSNENITLLSSV